MYFLGLCAAFLLCVNGHVDAYEEEDPTDQAESVNYQEQMRTSIENNDLNEVKHLIESSLVDIDDMIDRDSRNTPLLEAAKHGHFAIIKYLVEGGAYIHLTNLYYENALHVLIENLSIPQENSIEIVRYLVEKGMDVNAPGLVGLTPLMYACEGIRVKLFKFLMELGADIHAQAHNGCTVFMEAVSEDNIPVIKILVQNGVDLNVITKYKNQYECNAFIWSICKGSWNAFNYFVSKLHVDIHQVNDDGTTPLMVAAAHHQPRMLQKLIKLGVDVNARTTKPVQIHASLFPDIDPKYEKTLPVGSTALTFARHLDDEQIKRILSQAGGVE